MRRTGKAASASTSSRSCAASSACWRRWGFPNFKAYSVRAHLYGATRVFEGEFRKARSMAVRGSVYTAIRFERARRGAPEFSVYADGNHNGVRSVDIARGVDRRIAGPFPLHGGAPGVRVGILPGLPAMPPDRGPSRVTTPSASARATSCRSRPSAPPRRAPSTSPARRSRAPCASPPPRGCGCSSAVAVGGRSTERAVLESRSSSMTSRAYLLVTLALLRRGGPPRAGPRPHPAAAPLVVDPDRHPRRASPSTRPGLSQRWTEAGRFPGRGLARRSVAPGLGHRPRLPR